MRILVVGVFNENSTNNGILNGFAEIATEVDAMDYRERARDVGSAQRDQEIINCSDPNYWEGKYDLIFFCKCNGVDVRVIHECKKYAKTFLWYMDPLNSNYNDELIEKIKVADYVGVAKWEVYEQAKKLNPNTHFLIEGFDPKWDYPIESEKIYDVSFIGNPYGDRKEWLDALDNVTVLSNKYNTEHAKAVGQSKINLNFTGGGPSDRVYKILAAGGFLLSQRWPDIKKYGLRPTIDYVQFDTPDEMIRLCKYYLKNETEREQIARQGNKTVQKFSRDNLAKQIVEIVS